MSQETELFDPKKLYGPSDITERTGLGVAAINALRNTKKLPFIKLSCRTFKYKGSTLNQVFSEQFASE